MLKDKSRKKKKFFFLYSTPNSLRPKAGRRTGPRTWSLRGSWWERGNPNNNKQKEKRQWWVNESKARGDDKPRKAESETEWRVTREGEGEEGYKVRPKAGKSGYPEDHLGSRLLDGQLESKHHFYLHPLADSRIHILCRQLTMRCFISCPCLCWWGTTFLCFKDLYGYDPAAMVTHRSAASFQTASSLESWSLSFSFLHSPLLSFTSLVKHFTCIVPIHSLVQQIF